MSNSTPILQLPVGKRLRGWLPLVGAALIFSVATTSGCTKECLSDLDCDRAEDGTEQVCSVDNICVAITPSEVQSCGNNAQCDDGAVGGTGICWDGQCRYRPSCLLFDGPVSVASGCGTDFTVVTTDVQSEVQGPCTSTFAVQDNQPIHVSVDSLVEFEAQSQQGRVLPMEFGGVVELCTEGNYHVFEGVGFFDACSDVGGCAVAFRPASAGRLCDRNAPDAGCADDEFCAQINTLESRIGACLKM